jgi:hypothetical protein
MSMSTLAPLAPFAPFSDGKFLFTPLSRSAGHERYTASLSIRRGRGSQTQDSVYTFKPEFACRDSALAYAAEQGRHWLRGSTALA